MDQRPYIIELEGVPAMPEAQRLEIVQFVFNELDAIYAGPWLADAKRWFSKTGAPAVQDGRDKLVSGSPIRQEVLETALDWFSDRKIESYMSAHQHDKDAQELWQFWQAVFDWVKRVFPNQDSAQLKLMKGLPWGATKSRSLSIWSI